MIILKKNYILVLVKLGFFMCFYMTIHCQNMSILFKIIFHCLFYVFFFDIGWFNIIIFEIIINITVRVVENIQL